LQEAYEELERRITERTAELAAANEALKKRSEEIKLLAYSIAHDLKNPAIGIFGLTKRLQKHYAHMLDERGRTYCAQILNATEQIAGLVEKVNTYISAKEIPIRIERVKLHEILQLLREEFASRLSLRQITCVEPEGPWEMMADRLSISRILRNLLDNALKYGGDRLTTIRIGYQEMEDHHLLSVEDDGLGVEGGATERIFELFTRSNSALGIEGSGLGLAIVKEIAEQHQGTVWAEPGSNKGVTVYVSISKHL
jgi:signal transduction histidine kinase